MAAGLRKLNPGEFAFDKFVTTVGDSGVPICCCAIGWCPAIFANEVGWAFTMGPTPVPTYKKSYALDAACAFFEITPIQALYLFNPHWEKSPLRNNATAIEVAVHIEEFIKAHP